jgi:hypothetical protein
VNREIVASEIEGGVFLHDLAPYTVLHIETAHRCYTAVILAGNSVLISGHPTYCPEPVEVRICGSTWGGSMLKPSFIGRGMHLEFQHPDFRSPITTSRITNIREAIPQSSFPSS